MIKPLLQVALDHTDMNSALYTAKLLKDNVDVLEAGTILCAAEGAKVIQELRAISPQQILLADYKVADAGGTFAEIAFSHGATWLTVICAAPLPTMEAALSCAKKYNGDIQIELYGNWTFDDAQDWLELGIQQAVYHRGRDAQAAGQSWGKEDLKKIETLCNKGLKVSVTGGLVASDIALFKDMPVQSIYIRTFTISSRGSYKCLSGIFVQRLPNFGSVLARF